MAEKCGSTAQRRARALLVELGGVKLLPWGRLPSARHGSNEGHGRCWSSLAGSSCCLGVDCPAHGMDRTKGETAVPVIRQGLRFDDYEAFHGKSLSRPWCGPRRRAPRSVSTGHTRRRCRAQRRPVPAASRRRPGNWCRVGGVALARSTCRLYGSVCSTVLRSTVPFSRQQTR